MSISEEHKPLPLGKMTSQAFNKDIKAQKEKDLAKKSKLEDQARFIRMQTEDLFGPDPLQQMFDLFEQEMAQSPLADQPDPSATMGTPGGPVDLSHPVIQQRNQVDDAKASGMNPIESHETVHGETDLSNVDSKAKLSATLGRFQGDSSKKGVVPDKDGAPSLFAKDAAAEKRLDQVTRDDLRTPMRGQVPDRQQIPADQVAPDMTGEQMPQQMEEVSMDEDYDYNLDVAYLQTYGRA